MKIRLVERKLSLINELSTGLGLLIGYVGYSLFWLFIPETPIEIQTSAPTYKEITIGYMPKGIDELPTKEKMKELEGAKSIPIIVDSPAFNAHGLPALEKTNKTYSGLGHPEVVVKKIEILKPVLVDYSFYTPLTKDEPKYKFSPNIIYVGTGFYYEKKSVSFDGGNSPETFAIKVAVLFSLISVLLLLLRIRPDFTACKSRFMKTDFNVGDGDSFD